MEYDKPIDGIKGKQITVKELISLLQKCPQGIPVWHEGCDCWGEADRVEIGKDSEGEYVLIGRCR